MKIVHICAYYQDKLGYQEHYLGKAMQEMGHEVHFITSDVHFDFPDYEHTVRHIIGDKYVGSGLFYSDYGTPVHRIKATKKKYTGAIWLIGLRRKLRELNPDVIISHGIFSWHSVRLLFYPEIKKCRIIFDDHITINLVRKDPFSGAIYSIFRILFSARFLRISEKLIGISDTCIDVMRDTFGLTGNKIQMIPLGTDTTLFRRDDVARSEYRRNLALTDDQILVVYTGKIYELKNVHLIIEAINLLHCPPEKIVIHLVGDIAKSYQIRLQEAIQASPHRVIQLRALPVDQLPAVYNAADISVWPDHLTNSTIDASACGCPIICSTYMPERVKYGNGLLVKGGDLIELKTALKKLIEDESLRREMGKLGIAYVQNELSWQAVATRFLEEPDNS